LQIISGGANAIGGVQIVEALRDDISGQNMRGSDLETAEQPLKERLSHVSPTKKGKPEFFKHVSSSLFA
jgi:hypothetical protein